MADLQRLGQWAIVTGASSGIGAAFAEELAAHGMNVMLVARRAERLQALAERLESAHPIRVRVLVADLGTEAGTSELIAESRSLDAGLVVSNAGFGMKGGILELPLEEQLRMIELNCASQLRIGHAFGKRLAERRRGAIVFTASTAAFQATPYTSAYGASKAFLLSLAEGMAEELEPFGVLVQALCPGPTDTEGPRRTGVDPSRVPNMMTAREVVRASLSRLGARVVVPGAINKIASSLPRLVPRRLAAHIAGRMIRRATGG